MKKVMGIKPPSIIKGKDGQLYLDGIKTTKWYKDKGQPAPKGTPKPGMVEPYYEK